MMTSTLKLHKLLFARSLWVAACLVAFVLYLSACVANAMGADIVLPAYTGEGAVTRAVVINPTTGDLPLFASSTICTITGCYTIPGALIKAGAVYRSPAVVPVKGNAGIYHLSLDPSLIALSEIVTGAQALFYVYPLQALDEVKFIGLSHDGPYNPFLFIAADGDTVLSLWGNTVQLAKNQGAVLPTPADGTFEIVGQLGAPKFYVFAGINSQLNGSLQLVLPVGVH